jgi:hypothetical protein
MRYVYVFSEETNMPSQESNPLDHDGLTPDLIRAFADADQALRSAGTIPVRLQRALAAFAALNRSEVPRWLEADFAAALDALAKASQNDNSGITDQYLRLVNTTTETAQSLRMFFTIWNRTGEESTEPCMLLCRVSVRNIGLLNVTRSREFVETVVKRLAATSYPEAILGSRMQGVEIVVSAGARPHVLFADFVLMPPDSGIDPASAGGLLFNSFGDLFLEQMPFVEIGFPNVADWLRRNDLLNKESVRFLTTAHVQAHDLCGHSVPYSLKNATRARADWFVRAPLEELYADTQAMWIYSAPATRALLAQVLTAAELDAVPLMIAMKRLTFYALKDAADFDARCSWMMFCYWRKAGLIRRREHGGLSFFFDIERFGAVVEQMLTDVLAIEHQIANGAEAYESAGRAFSFRFGYENPMSKRWQIPDDLASIFGAVRPRDEDLNHSM